MRIRRAAALLGLAGFAFALGADRSAATRLTPEPPPAGAAQSKKGAHENDFVLFGTVFTEKGFALPGAEVRVRRAGERKPRWEARSDRRGEFAVRVPRGAEYEMSISAKGYQEQTRKIDARTGSREDLLFRLQPASGGKPK
jgi:carboxypeptidase family protein